jgi:hypothetical protein
MGKVTDNHIRASAEWHRNRLNVAGMTPQEMATAQVATPAPPIVVIEHREPKRSWFERIFETWPGL